MRRLHMEAARGRVSHVRLRILAPICLTVSLVLLAGTAAPSSGVAASGYSATAAPAARPARAAVPPVGAEPLMCRPEPPDYPGCSPRQVRPLLLALFAREYTGHAYGYRYYRMGQHPRGVIFAHLLPALNAHLAALYRAAVQRYAAKHTYRFIDDHGHRREIVTYPRYRTWAGFRAQATSFCPANNVTYRFPVRYCNAITKIGELGAAINALFRQTLRITFSCDGYAFGGWTSGSFMAWRLGTGLLRGGYYGAAGAEIACQSKNLWNWASNLW